MICYFDIGHTAISMSNSVENEEIATDLADDLHSMTEIEETEADMFSQLW